jgi:hypothetical protein
VFGPFNGARGDYVLSFAVTAIADVLTALALLAARSEGRRFI